MPAAGHHRRPFRSGPYTLPGVIAMGVPLIVAAGGGASESLSIFDPVSPPAESIRYLLLFVLAVVGAIFLVVEAVLLYSIVRFRRDGPAGNEPPQVYGSKPIEIAWTAAPALIVFLLVLIIIRTELEVRANPPPPRKDDHALYVTVIGHQWWWEYIYEHYNGDKLDVITANELHAPASTDGVPRPVYLTLKSADVCHSFWVPRLAGKTDLIPGRTNQMWFETSRSSPDPYLGQCAEFCGTQHANMLLRVYVDPPEEFERWLENEAKPAADDAKAGDGREAFLAQTCVNCHRVRGTRAQGTVGPDLTHLMSRRTLAAGMLENNRANLRQWVADPHTIKPGCLMAPFKQLGDRDVDRIVDYLMTLR